MSTEIEHLAPLPSVRPIDLYAALLADSRCENTRKARQDDLKAFSDFLHAPDPAQACALFISQGRGVANALGLAFREHERERGLSPASVNRRLATLRRLVKLARRFGIIEWSLDADDLPVTSFRDTRGPGREGWQKLWQAAIAAGDSPIAHRDRAMIRLLYDCALRKGEVVAIDLEDLDLSRPAVAIVGKGQTGKTWVSINSPTADHLRAWLLVRGSGPGPMFVNMRKFPQLIRISDKVLNRILVDLTEQAGLERTVRPHGLRHAAITRALDLTNGDLRKVQRFARHVSPSTTIRYDDARLDFAGHVAGLLGGDDDPK